MSKLTLISNLLPRPDAPTRGMYNHQLFAEIGARTSVEQICLVPRLPGRLRAVRDWVEPPRASPTTYVPYLHLPVVGRNLSAHFVARALGRHFAAHPPERILTSWLYPDGVGAVHAAAAYGIRPSTLVLGSDCHHLQRPARRDQILAALRVSGETLCVAEVLRQQLIEAGVAAEGVRVVPNGVDSTRFHPLGRAEAWGRLLACGELPAPTVRLLESGEPFILFVGNFVAVKRPALALEATIRLNERRQQEGLSPMPIVMLGQGPQLAELARRAISPLLKSVTHLVGARPHAEIPLWMNLAGVLLLTSRSEGMPNVVIEMLACGGNVVATDVGCCEEMLAGKAGCLVTGTDDGRELGDELHGLLPTLDHTAPRSSRWDRSWGDMAEEVLGKG